MKEKKLSESVIVKLSKYTDNSLRVSLVNPSGNSKDASLNIHNTKLEENEFLVKSSVDGGEIIDFLESNNIAQRIDKPLFRTGFANIPIMKLNPRNVWRFSKFLKKKQNA